MADVREVESELGGLVYQSLGTVSFSHPEEAADFPVPPGYARLVAVSSRYGLTVLADHAGLCVAHTDFGGPPGFVGSRARVKLKPGP